MKYWIDADPGVDDAIAIILAAKKIGDDLIGLSSVQGNFVETVSTHNLIRIIEKLRESNIVTKHWAPVIARGSNLSLKGPPYRSADSKESYYHGKDGLADVTRSAPSNWPAMVSKQAAQEIYDWSRSSKNFTLVCLGPLTNVAIAILLNSDLPKFVTNLVIMGGSFRVGGNETMAAEFNFMADPEAAQLVLSSGFQEIKIIPLDPCYDVRFSKNELRRLNEISRGASIADWQKCFGNKPNVMVAASIPDRDAFFDKFFDLIAN